MLIFLNVVKGQAQQINSVGSEAVVKRLGTFPKVQHTITNNNQQLHQLQQIKNKQQDTSPVRLTFDMSNYMQNDASNSSALTNFVTTNQHHNNNYTNQIGPQGYQNMSTRQNENWNNNQEVASTTNMTQKQIGNSNYSGKQQFLSQNQSKQAYLQNNQNTKSNQYVSQQARLQQQSYLNQPNSNQQNSAFKYEQMAQNLNLESLIKQAKERSGDANNLKIAIQYDFKNQINTFKGDNDYVEEELDTSNDNSGSERKSSVKRTYSVEDEEQQDINFEKQQQQLSSSEYMSPQKYYSKKPNVEDLTPTGGCNIISSGGRSAEDHSYLHAGHLMSDLSQKVVNINSINGTNLNNPFNHTPSQQQIQFLSQLQSAAQESQNTAKLDYDNSHNQSNDEELPKYRFNNNYEEVDHEDDAEGQGEGNSESEQNNNEEHYLEYSASASALNQKSVTNPTGINGHAYNKSITPFDLLTKDYLSKKSEVVNKYSNLNSDDEHEEVSFLDPTHRTETPTEREQHNSQDDQIINSLEKAVEQTDIASPSEPQQQSYRTAKEEQSHRSQHNPLATEDDNYHPILSQNYNDNNGSENLYNDTQALFTFKPQNQPQQQQNLVPEVQVQQQLHQQQQKLQDLSSRNIKSRQEDKFLTLDDFIQRKSLAQMKDTSKVLETPKDDEQQLESQRNRIQEDKSPRIIDKSQLLQREKDQEIKKKKQLELLKIKAIEKEKAWQKRLNSAIVIQKWTRGFLQRIQYARMQKNFRYMRKLRRMLSIAYGKIKIKRVRALINVLKEVGQNVKNEKDDLMQKYMDHCATSVQKLWRGYYARSYFIEDQILQNKRQRLLNTVVKGWKIRKILASCREVLAIKRSLFEIENTLKQTGNRNKQQLSSLMQERRRKIEELCKIVPTLYRNGRWIFSYQKKLQGIQSKALIRSQNNNSNNINSFVNLKQAQAVQFNQNQHQQHHYGSQMSQQLIRGQNGILNQEKMVDFPLQRLPSQQFRISDIDIASENKQVPYQQNQKERQQQQQQYPVYQQQMPQYQSYQNYEKQTEHYQQRPQYQNSPELKEKADIGWPSKHHADSQSEDDSQIMWASSAINSLKQSQKQVNQPQKSVNNQFQQKRTSFENTTGQFENMEIQTERTAVGEKLEILERQMKPQYTKRQNNNEDEFNDSQFYTQSKFQSSQKLDFANEILDNQQNKHPQFDDMPIKPLKQNYDDIPIKSNKNNNNNNNNPNDQSGFQNNNLHDEKPIKSMLNSSQYQTLDESMVQKKPQYNFEEMIEQALGQQSDVPLQNNKKIMPKRSKTTRNDSRQDNESQGDHDSQDDSSGQIKSVKQKKKQNLKKRQKYDPRKAIEEAKKTQENQKIQSKSAFPEGVLTKNDRTRSATGLPRINDEELKEQTLNVNTFEKLPKPNKKRQTYQQQQQQQQMEDEQKQDGLDDENGHQTSTNASSSQGGSKAFLKRKSKQVLNFQKCNWNAKSRVSCWTNNKTDRSNNQSQTRKSTSQMRSPRVELTKVQPEKVEQVANNNASTFNKINNKKGIPPPSQINYSSTTHNTATINLEQLQHQNQLQQQQQQIKNQKNVPQLKPQAIQQLQQQQQQMQLKQKSGSTLPQNIGKMNRHDDGFDGESIPDETYQMRESISNNDQVNQYDPNYEYKQLQNQQNNSQNSLMQTQLTMSNLGQYDELMANTQNAQAVDLQHDTVTLQLEELEKIIELFHPKPQSFVDSEIKENRRHTCVPHMSLNSMFFTCYSDDIYDTILEDLREHYISLCNE